MSVFAIADDLSGAAETAAALLCLGLLPAQNAQFRGSSGGVLDLYNDELMLNSTCHDIKVIDSNSRHVASSTAAARMRSLLGSEMAQRANVYLKFDSLLRGNISSALAAAMDTHPVVFCPALPVLGRTVRNGTLQVEGVPLHKTNLWQAEPGAPQQSIPEQLALQSTVVPLEVVRSSRLPRVLRSIADSNRLSVCDAESPADLDLIASSAVSEGISLAGAAGLAQALARHLQPARSLEDQGNAGVRTADVLFILGTASPTAANQLAELRSTGIPIHHVLPADLTEFSLPDSGTAAIAVDGALDPTLSGWIVKALADLALRLHANRHLVLSGGETARAVLDALQISRLYPLAEAHPGAVVSATCEGRLIATRPGSHGDVRSLTQILTTMNALQINNPRKALL